MHRLPLLVLACCAALAIGGAAHAEQKAFLRAFVNGVEKQDLVVVLRGADALCPAAGLEAAGLRNLAGKRERHDGQELISLASLAPALRFRIDEQAAALRIEATPDHLEQRRLDLATNFRPPEMVFSAVPGFYLNYALETHDAFRPNLFAEAGTSVGHALLYSGLSRMAGGPPVRGLSNFTFDAPGALTRVVIGDAFAASGGALGSSLLLGGVSVSREFSLDPYFISAPHLDVRGATATPSRMEVYVDGRLAREEPLAPGPFELANLPLFGSSGDTRVVVRDAFGRAQEYGAGYLAPANLLEPGLNDFSWQVGFRRLNFSGESFDYSAPALFARHRIGLSRWLTAGLRFEGDRDAASGGPTLTLSTPIGAIDLAGAVSRTGPQSGTAGSLTLASSARHLGLSAQFVAMSAAFSNLALAPRQDRARLSMRLLASTSLGPASFSVGQSMSQMRDAGISRAALFTAGLPLGGRVNLSLSGSLQYAPGPPVASGFVGLSVALDGLTSANATAQRGSGGTQATTQVQRAVPAGTGVGYLVRLQDSDRGLSTAAGSADVQYQSEHGLYEASYGRTATSNSWTARAAGALVVADGDMFATRPVQDGFAVIEVPSVGGVRGYLNNQEMGRTDSGGKLLIPGVLPYYGNRFSIADRDIPLNYRIGTVERTVAGPVRGAALVRFGVQRTQAYTGLLAVGAGRESFIAANGELDLRGPMGEQAFPVGLQGQFFVEEVPAGTYEATLRYAGRKCRFTLALPESQKPALDVGRVGCPRLLEPGARLAGRLFLDTNGDGKWQPGEPVLDGVQLAAGEKRTATDAAGRFEFSGVPSGALRLAAASGLELPAGYRLDAQATNVAVTEDGELTRDLAVRPPKPLKDLGSYFLLDTPGGPLRLNQIQAATFPLNTWTEGRELSRQEDAAVQNLGTEVLDAPDLRVFVVVKASPGDRATAVRQSLKAARAALRYLKGPALVPPSRLLWTLIEPAAGDREAGHVDVLLVRVPLQRAEGLDADDAILSQR